MNQINAQPPSSWHADLQVGHAPMDHEHEVFRQLIGALQQAADADLAPALDALAAHAEKHFADENGAMEETDFPARACHADEHAAVLRSVRGVQRRLATGDVAVVRRLCAELQAWFPAHVQHLDSALAQWICKLRLGGKPVVLRRSLVTHP
jgi:hemerythrin-like metal-binding protein